MDCIDHLPQVVEALVTDVVEAPDEGADVAGAGAGAQKRLGRGEDERHVDAGAPLGEVVDRRERPLRDGELDHDVGGQRRQALALLDHALGGLGRGLGRDGQERVQRVCG